MTGVALSLMTVRLLCLIFKEINPLQVLRDIVVKSNLSHEDILYRMKLRATDPPLSFAAFKESLKRLD
jgi:hypothetical protein